MNRSSRGFYLAAAQRAEEAIALLPDDPNSWYFHAFNLGRYSQSISIVTRPCARASAAKSRTA